MSSELKLLRKKLDRLESQLLEVRHHLQFRDGVPFHLEDGVPLDTAYRRVRANLNDYTFIADRNMRLQLEGDNLLMLRARADDDFLEFCRLALFQVEAYIKHFMKRLQGKKPALVNALWDEQQKRFAARTSWHKKKMPSDLNRANASSLIDIGFMVAYGPDYEKTDKINFQYFSIQNARRFRNVGSHRESKGVNWDEIASDEILKRFYEERHQFNYFKLPVHIGQFMNDVERAWPKMLDATPKKLW